MCSVQEIFTVYINSTAVIAVIYFPRVQYEYVVELSSYHTAAHQVEQYRTPNKKQQRRSRLDFLFKKMGAFYTNFSIIIPEFLAFPFLWLDLFIIKPLWAGIELFHVDIRAKTPIILSARVIQQYSE